MEVLNKYFMQKLSRILFGLYLCKEIKCYRVVKEKQELCIFCKPKN